VVGVRDFLCENETVYLVMNYLEGASLQDFINTARELAQPTIFSQATILSLFEEVLRGLRVVHQHKMLHLDIKPDNIFITDDNLSVLVDFGASREALRLESQHMAPMYTPGFAAPEMYRRDGAVGPWTDIYAIGACMYACMRGQAPDAYPQRMETEGMTGALARLRDHYCGWLLEAVAWCMELAPEARPQTVFALQHALSSQLARASEIAEVMAAVASEVRLARFLLQRSARMAVYGQSSRQLRLPMSRRDIASHLGVAHETVSRSFGELANWGFISVENREIGILDVEALKAFARMTRGMVDDRGGRGGEEKRSRARSKGASPNRISA
jgi:serine/threonine protein kinase